MEQSQIAPEDSQSAALVESAAKQKHYKFDGETVAAILERTKIREEDIDPFCVIPGSQIRPIHSASVERLMRSMLEKGYVPTSVLVVNEVATLDGSKLYRCIEGLHRIEALKRLIVTLKAQNKGSLAKSFEKVKMHVHEKVSQEAELFLAMALNDEKEEKAPQTFFTKIFFLQRRLEVMTDEQRCLVYAVSTSSRMLSPATYFSFKPGALFKFLQKEGPNARNFFHETRWSGQLVDAEDLGADESSL